jgi:hypothetical protein
MAVPVKIEGTITAADGTTQACTVVGDMTMPTDSDIHPEHPIVIPPEVPPDVHPEHPIVLPPETTPPEGGEKPPALWMPLWVPGYGWIAVPCFPHPTPSKGRRR